MEYKTSKWKGGTVKDFETFINKAIWIFLGEKYDYSKCSYKGILDKVEVVCPEHGSFWIRPYSHLAGHGCKQCGNASCSKTKMLSTEQFINKSKQVHGDKYSYDSSDYKGDKINIEIRCPIHGIFEIRPSHHMQGRGCRACAMEDLSSDTESFVGKAILVHGNKYDYSNVIYRRAKEKVEIICKHHGPFLMQPNAHLNGQNCPQCASINRSWSLTKEQKKANYSTYLLKITSLNDVDTAFYKVGITSYPIKDRFSKLQKDGYTFEKICVYQDTGEACRDLESSVLSYLRDNNSHRKCRYLEKSFSGGWTECFEDDSLLQGVIKIFQSRLEEV